jgi:peptide subunit release factor 1 (eRF1)
VRGVADRLLRAHQRQPFQHLVVICSDELRPVIEHSLHAELTAVLAATIDADLEHAPVGEIVAVIAPVIERVGREEERNLISRLEQQLGTGGSAAAGLDDVLSALEEQRVETLLVPERSDLRAGLCPTCGRLSTDGECRCPLDRHVLEKAAGQSTQVVVAPHEPEWLHGHGDIAALLRW